MPVTPGRPRDAGADPGVQGCRPNGAWKQSMHQMWRPHVCPMVRRKGKAMLTVVLACPDPAEAAHLRARMQAEADLHMVGLARTAAGTLAVRVRGIYRKWQWDASTQGLCLQAA